MAEESRDDLVKERWLDKASSPNLSEDDYQSLLEELPSDPQARKEWIEELKVVLAMEVVQEEKSPEWVKAIVEAQIEKKSNIIPIFMKGLAAVLVLSVGLFLVLNSNLFRGEGDGASQGPTLVRNDGDESTPVPDQPGEFDGKNSDDSITFEAPDVRAVLYGDGVVPVALDEGGESAEVLQGDDQRIAAQDLKDASTLPSDVDLPENRGAVLATGTETSTLPLDHLKNDPFDLKKKKKRRTMVAAVEDGGAKGDTYFYELEGSSPFRPFVATAKSSVASIPTTFGSGSFEAIRRDLIRHRMPKSREVKVEEMIHYFDDQDPYPKGTDPFSLQMELGISLMDESQHLLKLGIKGRVDSQRPQSNLVLLLDSSASMALSQNWENMKAYLETFFMGLRKDDRVSIMTFGGESNEILSGISGRNHHALQGFLESLKVGGQMNNDEDSLVKAYGLAGKYAREKVVSRVVVVTDGAATGAFAHRIGQHQFVAAQSSMGVKLSVLNLTPNSSGEEALRELVEQGGGSYYNVINDSTARKALAESIGSRSLELAKDVNVRVVFNPDVVSSYRMIGYESKEKESEDLETSTGPDLVFLGHRQTTLFEIIPKAGVEAGAKALELIVSYKEPRGDLEKVMKKTLEWEENSLKSTDFQWTEAVAIWSRMLQGHPGVKDFPVSYLLDVGRESVSDDPYGYRKEMLLLVQAWDELRQGIDPRQLPMLQFWKDKKEEKP